MRVVRSVFSDLISLLFDLMILPSRAKTPVWQEVGKSIFMRHMACLLLNYDSME